MNKNIIYKFFYAKTYTQYIITTEIIKFYKFYKSDAVKTEAWENAIPEFKRHNIVENDLEDIR